VTDAGLSVLALLGVERLAGWLAALSGAWDTPEDQDTIVWSAHATESERSLRGLSSHMILVARVAR
jgi:hypothetical protein